MADYKEQEGMIAEPPEPQSKIQKVSCMKKMSRSLTKLMMWALCPSAQSDQSLHCPHKESLRPLATHLASSEDSDQTGLMPTICWAPNPAKPKLLGVVMQ